MHAISFKKDPKVYKKSIVTQNNAIRNKAMMDRPHSSKNQVRTEQQKKINMAQQKQINNQIFNEYNDTIESSGVSHQIGV